MIAGAITPLSGTTAPETGAVGMTTIGVSVDAGAGRGRPIEIGIPGPGGGTTPSGIASGMLGLAGPSAVEYPSGHPTWSGCFGGVAHPSASRSGAVARRAARGFAMPHTTARSVPESVREPRRIAAYASASIASSTWATWPFTLTLGQCFATLPSLPIRTVERMMPFIFLPYMTLSPHAP